MTTPNPMATPVFSQKAGSYTDISSSSIARDLMNAQLATNTPQPPSGVFSIVSDPLLPDRTVTDRIGNMDPDIYDLRETSNIVKLLTALLGGAGVGGLRKQTAVARLENSFRTTHFLDLDRFYGALFGIVRTKAELMPDFGALTDDSDDLVQAQNPAVSYTLHRDADMTGATVYATATPYTWAEEFEVSAPTLVASLRYWRQSSAYAVSAMAILDEATQQPVAGTSVTPINPPAGPAWHQTDLAAPVLLSPGRYLVAGLYPSGYGYVPHTFDSGGILGTTATAGPCKLLSKADATDGMQASYAQTATLTYPTGPSASASTFGLDLVYSAADVATTSGGVQFNPYTDAAGSDVWDDVHSRDASYRSRLVKFAKAIPQGGTYPGLLAAAEAILAVDCELYESWSWVDDTADHGGVVMATGYTWGQIERAFKNWQGVERGHTWSTFAGRVLNIGRTGTSNRSEVLLQPKRQLREDEKFQLVRVLNALKPMGISITVDSQGLAVHDPIAIRAVAADSEYWEVISKVVPNTKLTGVGGASVYQQSDPGKAQPRPAFSQYTGEKWSYNNDVTTVTSYEMEGGATLTKTDYETVVYADGTSHSYVPSDGLIPGAHAAGARAASDGVLTSYPYCAVRT